METKRIEFIYSNQQIVDKICAVYFTDSFRVEEYKQEFIKQLVQSDSKKQEEYDQKQWMYQVALNAAIDLKRKQKTQLRDVKRVHSREDPEWIDRNSAEGKLLDGLQLLTPVNKAIAILMLDGFDYKQIAQVVGFDETNTGVKMESIKSNLMEFLNEVTSNELEETWNNLIQQFTNRNEMNIEAMHEIVEQKNKGLLSKIFKQLKRDIIINITGLTLLLLVMLGVTTTIGAINIDFSVYAAVFIIFALLVFKLLKDIRTYRMVKMPTLTGSIKSSSIESYRIFKSHRRKTKATTILFLAAINIFAIFTYYQTLDSYYPFNYSDVNIQIVDMQLGLIVITGLIILPVIVNFYNKSKFKKVTEDYESTLRELIP